MALTKKQRDRIPAKHYAVPETQQLPIEDAVHVKMAWSMVNKTKGLSNDQRKSARERILKRAKELGMDTSEWDKSLNAAPDANDPYPEKGSLNELKGDIDEQVDYDDKENLGGQEPYDPSNDKEMLDQELEREQEEEENADQERRLSGMTFHALAIEFPDDGDEDDIQHPNKTPFKGILTRVDEPSDNPLSGSNGKCVILPKAVAESALGSLLGMAIDFKPNFDGHDAQKKIGIITEATINGDAINIVGYFYGADFPSEVKRIQAEKSQLGFSYEAQAQVKSMNDDPLVIKNCIFTGAAVLYKDLAAYTTTSLAAKKMEIDEMTPELEKVIKDLQDQVASLKTKLNASAEATKLAAGNVQHLVKPHADAMRACAQGMAAAGMGMHAKMGHVAVMNGMADQMEADAVLGKMPHIYQTPDFYSAAADKSAKANEETSTELKKVTETIEAMSTQLKDLKAQAFEAAKEPTRKTLDPAILKILAKNGIKGAENGTIAIAELDKQLDGSNMPIRDRMALKLNLDQAGKIA